MTFYEKILQMRKIGRAVKTTTENAQMTVEKEKAPKSTVYVAETKKPPKAEKKAFNKVIKNDNGTNKKS